MARKFRNLHIFGCWWFTNIPSVIEEMTRMRIELLGLRASPCNIRMRGCSTRLFTSGGIAGASSRGCWSRNTTGWPKTGWQITRAEVERDVKDLLGGAFERFLFKLESCRLPHRKSFYLMTETSASPAGTIPATQRFLPLLLLLFVGSGCAALIYEIVWLQLLQLVIGSSAVSLGVLLGTFMGGMCLGSLRPCRS